MVNWYYDLYIALVVTFTISLVLLIVMAILTYRAGLPKCRIYSIRGLCNNQTGPESSVCDT